MSAPLPFFQVRMMVGRELHRNIRARDEQAAEDIAHYLFQTFADRYFRADNEDIVDTIITATGEDSL